VLNIVLGEAPRLIRAGLHSLVSAQVDMQVVVEAGDSPALLAGIHELPRHSDSVAIAGLGLPGPKDSFWLIRAIRDRAPWLPILVCGSRLDEMAVSRVLFMGADSVAGRDCTADEFIDAIRRTAVGERVLAGVPAAWPERVSQAIVQVAQIGPMQIAPMQIAPMLTARERQVLAVAGEGLTARQIGSRLGVRERTVTTHLGRIYKKLGTSGRIAALTSAAQSGLVPMDQTAG
jgi:DNA-binding NarL/FixJ family response regulator